MIDLEVKDLSVQKKQELLVNGVSPRPIALVSTISEDGTNNLSPFSFYNAFGSNPPVVAFSPSRRVRDGSFKDTYFNLVQSWECVIHAVTHSMVEQVNLASCEYPAETDEFVKSGFTPIDSDIVKPKRVKESPFQMECKLLQMVNCGGDNGSGNIAICEVVKFHISEHVYTDGMIDPNLLDLVGRNGAEFYTRASGDAIFTLQKPGSRKGMGFDNLPEFIKNSSIYTANNLGKIAMYESFPSGKEISDFINSLEYFDANEYDFIRFSNINDYKKMLSVSLSLFKQKNPKTKIYMELSAKAAIDLGDVDFGLKTALYIGKLFNE